VPGERRFLGIDYGSKRIGIALSDPLNIIAQGIRVIPKSPRAIEEIRLLVDEYEIETIVVGLPLSLSGREGQGVRDVEAFIQDLQGQTGCTIVRVDERFTTTVAHATMRAMGTSKKQRRSKERIDEMASALILQSFLDKRRR